MPLYPFLGEGSPTKIDYRKKVGTLILASLLEDPGERERERETERQRDREGERLCSEL